MKRSRDDPIDAEDFLRCAHEMLNPETKWVVQHVLAFEVDESLSKKGNAFIGTVDASTTLFWWVDKVMYCELIDEKVPYHLLSLRLRLASRLTVLTPTAAGN